MANIQFNSKDAKAFRTICEKFYNAQHTLADARNKCNDRINRYQSDIEDFTEDLQAIADGTYRGHRDADAIQADIEDRTARISDAKSDLKDIVSKQDKAIADALVLYTDTMHTAMGNVVATFGSDDALVEWRTALADSLIANGIKDATPDNVARFDFLVVAKTNNSKKVYKDNCLIASGGKKQTSMLFCCALSEYLVAEGLITPFAHKYIPVSLRNKNK